MMRADRDGRLTVLMTADAVGGVWTYALGLCSALPDIRFVLAVMGPPPRVEQCRAVAALPNVALEIGDYRLEWMQDGPADVAPSRRWLVRLARRHGADLVHVNAYAQAKLPLDRPALAVAHSDVLSWWRAVHGATAPAEWDPYRRNVIAGLAAADAVVAPSRAVRDDLWRNYRLPPADTIVIPNGIDPARYASRTKRDVIMAAGRLWDAAKHLGHLASIAHQLDWPVLVAGDGTHPDSGAAELGGVRMLGVLSPAEMAQRLGEAAIFVAPTCYEPFGLTILEAAASGCALVLGDIPSLRENWGEAALFVPRDKGGALADALQCLIGDPRERRRLAAAARRRAEKFTLAAMATRYRALYAALAERRSRREVA